MHSKNKFANQLIKTLIFRMKPSSNNTLDRKLIRQKQQKNQYQNTSSLYQEIAKQS
jgi:hypothetical protein